MKENVDVEFKGLNRMTGALDGNIAREIISFANTEGGDLYIGIRDDGSIAGVDNPDNIMTRLSSVLHDTILPDIMPFLQIRSEEMNGKTVIRVTVMPGTERPYYLASEGLKPKGVYVRRGSACIPLDETGIREMILQTSGNSFEECRSLNQDLTFRTMNEEMINHHLDFGTAQMHTLKMIGSDGLYTNLALLLSDQCPYTIKAAVFQDRENPVFRERKEFTGSLLKQLNDAYQFLDFYNKTAASFSGLQRHDQRDYPPDALREALLNAMIHRSYFFSGSTIINIFEDHIEFVSLGGLVSGISMDAIYLGISQSRNPNLAAVFYRLGLVESYGTGIRKIMHLYKGFHTPTFKTAEGAFLAELYNRNESDAPVSSLQMEETTPVYHTDLTADLLALAHTHGCITRKEVEELYHYGTTKAFKILKDLCKEGLLVQHKNGNQTVYLPR